MSIETARPLTNSPIVAGVWGVIRRELQRLLSLIGYGSTGGVCGRSLMAGKILFTGRQTCSLYFVLWLWAQKWLKKVVHAALCELRRWEAQHHLPQSLSSNWLWAIKLLTDHRPPVYLPPRLAHCAPHCPNVNTRTFF